MDQAEDRTNLTAVWRMADLITPMALRVAATLRIADRIAEGHTELDDLAARAGANPDALRRLLRYLTARGVFAEPAPDSFALEEPAAILLDAHPSGTRAWLDLEGFGGRMDLAFAELLPTVRAGRPPRHADDESLSPEERASYDDLMEHQNRAQARAVVAAFDWTGVERIVDVGGGTGALISELLRTFPAMRATLLELPGTAEKAQRLLAADGIAERALVAPGSMFDAVPPSGDVYLLKFVLHGFDDARSVGLLRSCASAGRAGSRVLVVERTVGPADDRLQFTAMDLRMLILGEGRERTLEEYAALGAEAGLALRSVTPTSVGVHLIELRSPPG